MKNFAYTIAGWTLGIVIIVVLAIGLARIAHAEPAVLCGTNEYLNFYTNNCEGYPGTGLYPQEPHYPGQEQWDRTHRGY